MKRVLKLITMFVLSLTAVLAFTSCEEGPDFPYKDMIERPSDIPPLNYLDYVKYPEKPADVKVGQGEGMPTVGTATTESTNYKIQQADGKITIKFNEVERWEYIYLPISNFNKEYQNIKITATGTNIQKLSIAALYAEMDETKNPAVTVLNHDVGDTEQYYIMQLGKTRLVDKSYYPIDEYLGSKTVYALCIFIDSNPSQNVVNKKTDIESVFEITAIEFLKDGDPSIKEVYVAPSINVGMCDGGYLCEKDQETGEFDITKTDVAGLYECAALSVTNYSSSYTTLNVKFTTENVKQLTIELQIAGGLAGWADNVTVYQSNLTDGEHEANIDFSMAQPYDSTTWDTVAGYYIKNYKIVAVKFYLDTIDQTYNEMSGQEGTCVVNEIGFERVEQEGTIIGKGWNAASSNIVIGDDLAVGGIGTITYNWHQDWDYLGIPVANYTTAQKLVVEFQASEELAYFGIALGCASFPLGELVLKSCHDDALYEAEKLGNAEGVVETIEFDEDNLIYKITFDFTNAIEVEKFNDKSCNEMTITSLRFYFTDPYGDDVFEGTRTIRFINVSFE